LLPLLLFADRTGRGESGPSELRELRDEAEPGNRECARVDVGVAGDMGGAKMSGADELRV